MWTTYSTFLAYDTRFRNDDVVSTLFKLLQIGVLVVIAGYTNCACNLVVLAHRVVFDVGALGDQPAALNADGSTDTDVYYASYNHQAWAGIALAFALGRYVAALQWAYVAMWARMTGRRITLALVLPMLASLMTAVAWTAVRQLRNTDWAGTDDLRYAIAYISIGIELACTVITARLRSAPKTHHSLAAERYRLLTLLVLGEGILGIAKVLSTTVGSFGFSVGAVGQAFLAVLIVTLLFHLLFVRMPKGIWMGRVRSSIWTLLHFPLHVCVRRASAMRLTVQLLLLLEGVSAALLNVNLGNALVRRSSACVV